jgi:hypothetical protein
MTQPNHRCLYTGNTGFGDIDFTIVELLVVIATVMLLAALFLTNLSLDADTRLIISNHEDYFITSNGFSTAQASLLGNGGLHQLVPEPNVMLLWLSSFAAVCAARRWAKQERR